MSREPTCTCGHPRATHHPTPTGRHTWCSVWDTILPGSHQCACRTYTPTQGV